MAKTLYDKIWDAHLVDAPPGETPVLYIDRHLVHEVTSPQAFEGLRLSGRKVRRPELTLAVADHNVPTKDRDKGITEPESRLQVETLEKNAHDFRSSLPFHRLFGPAKSATSHVKASSRVVKMRRSRREKLVISS